MSGMIESDTVKLINDQVPDTLAHYQAQQQEAAFHVAALALLDEAKVYVSRCAGGRPQALSKTITDFIAKHRRKMP